MHSKKIGASSDDYWHYTFATYSSNTPVNNYFYSLVQFFPKLDEVVVGFFVGNYDEGWRAGWNEDKIDKHAPGLVKLLEAVTPPSLEKLIVAQEVSVGVYRVSRLRYLQAETLQKAYERLEGMI